MRSCAAAGTLLLFQFFPAPAFAAPRDCKTITGQAMAGQARAPHWRQVGIDLELVEGRTYRLFDENGIADGIEIRHVTFEKLEFEGSQPSYLFRTHDSKIIKVRGQLAGWRPGVQLSAAIAPDSLPPSRLEAFFSAIFGVQLLAQKMGRIVFAPYRTRWKGDGLLIVGGSSLGDQKVAEIGSRITAFDARLARLGLKKPRQTRVILADGPLPDLSGPCSIHSPIFSFWNARCLPTIDLTNFKGNRTTFDDPAVILHERAHSLLHASFHPQSIITRSGLYQEMLADILAAHYSGNPRIGAGFPEPGQAMRDLSLAPIRGVGLESSTDYHSNSLHLSSLLWSIRGELVKTDPSGTQFELLLSELLKRLDRYDEAALNFKSVLVSRITGRPAYTFDFISEYVYALVHIEQQLEAMGLRKTWDHVSSQSPWRLSARQLERSMQSMRENLAETQMKLRLPPYHPVSSLILHAAAGGLVAEGYILYEILEGDE